MDDPAVSIVDVAKRYGAVQALDGVSLIVARGEILGLLGPNGAGKTTLISALAGLIRCDRGRIAVLGQDVVADYRQARRCIGVVPQELVFDPFFTVRETLQFQSGYFGLRDNEAWIDELLLNLDLTAKANANMRSLSGGMKRRVLVAQALVHRPQVIVLDEPTAGVDVELRQGLWRFVRRLNQEGHTIILTTHYLEEAESLCDRIAMLKAGRIVALASTASLIAGFRKHSLRLRLTAGAALPLSSAQRCDDGWWTIDLAVWGEAEAVLAACRAAGIEVLDMELVKPSLESVFVETMSAHHEDTRRAA
jgi:ABC-2 type transport system ATP-binding protein